MMRQLLRELFRLDGTNTKNDAKQRLQVLLVHDEIALTPAQMEHMRAEILDVVAKYCDVEAEGVDFRLERGQGSVSIVSNMPVRRTMGRTRRSPA